MPDLDTVAASPLAPSLRLTATSMILVAERDAHVRDLLVHFLRGAGFEVELAPDGSAALDQARRLQPALLITEIMLPKLDGLALCRQLKAEPTTRGIAVLVFSMLSARARATEAGADAFLLKPLSEQRLVSTVTELLRDRRATKDLDA
jgi:DNA-binding response OmpR family regulator